MVGHQLPLHILFIPPLILHSPISVEGVKEFLQSDDVDVWRVTADGMADVRINKYFLQKSNRVIKTECVAIANVEDLVQQFEINSIRNETQVADDLWFEDYVSAVHVSKFNACYSILSTDTRKYMSGIKIWPWNTVTSAGSYHQLENLLKGETNRQCTLELKLA